MFNQIIGSAMFILFYSVGAVDIATANSERYVTKEEAALFLIIRGHALENGRFSPSRTYGTARRSIELSLQGMDPRRILAIKTFLYNNSNGIPGVPWRKDPYVQLDLFTRAVNMSSKAEDFYPGGWSQSGTLTAGSCWDKTKIAKNNPERTPMLTCLEQYVPDADDPLAAFWTLHDYWGFKYPASAPHKGQQSSDPLDILTFLTDRQDDFNVYDQLMTYSSWGTTIGLVWQWYNASICNASRFFICSQAVGYNLGAEYSPWNYNDIMSRNAASTHHTLSNIKLMRSKYHMKKVEDWVEDHLMLRAHISMRDYPNWPNYTAPYVRMVINHYTKQALGVDVGDEVRFEVEMWEYGSLEKTTFLTAKLAPLYKDKGSAIDDGDIFANTYHAAKTGDWEYLNPKFHIRLKSIKINGISYHTETFKDQNLAQPSKVAKPYLMSGSRWMDGGGTSILFKDILLKRSSPFFWLRGLGSPVNILGNKYGYGDDKRGKYFNMFASDLDDIFGDSSWTGITCPIKDLKTGIIGLAIFWRTSAGDTAPGNAYGRWLLGSAAYQWESMTNGMLIYENGVTVYNRKTGYIETLSCSQ